ncbi:MAG TPA: hypothetical protein VFL42_03065 [Terriglobales bacterium]|nr:hypothetical protein [Terriglobales bacterium]
MILVLAGCNSYEPVIHAQVPVPTPTPAPTPQPAQCFPWGSCAAFEVHPWGTCQWQTEQGSTTFTAQVEIGILHTPTDAQDKHCSLLFAKNLGMVRAISGNVNYISEGVDRASMAVRVLTPGYGSSTEWLTALKFAVRTKGEESLPFYQRFDLPIATQGLWVDFDDDLDGSKPTTLSVSFQGTLAP